MFNNIDKISLAIAGALAFLIILLGSKIAVHKANAKPNSATWWQVQSIDTMKHSRDLAREKLYDESFDETIDFQMKNISELGATHVAIGTPYDEEFLPILTRWVSYARKYNLNVWFRGNFSGWEEWFDYDEIDKDEHHALLEEFILKNPTLFQDGDIFTSCPECENGALGDPRHTGRVTEFREFLIDEYETANDAFEKINKDVSANYYSMNGDVARLIMDKETTTALDGIVVIDHYVKTPEQLVEDIRQYANNSGGKVVLGEIGVPIPDIHGGMTEEMQSQWLKEAFTQIAKEEAVLGINYWVLTGGSTEIWPEGKNKREIADVISTFYKPATVSLKITNELGSAISGATVKVGHNTFIADSKGNVEIAAPPGFDEVVISADGYKSYSQRISNPNDQDSIILSQERESLLFRILKFIRSLLK